MPTDRQREVRKRREFTTYVDLTGFPPPHSVGWHAAVLMLAGYSDDEAECLEAAEVDHPWCDLRQRCHAVIEAQAAIDAYNTARHLTPFDGTVRW